MAKKAAGKNNKSFPGKDFWGYWIAIEKKAFSPSFNEMKGWLRCYLQFLNKKFENEDDFPGKIQSLDFDFNLPHTKCSCSITPGHGTIIEKYSVTIALQIEDGGQDSEEKNKEVKIRFDYSSENRCEFDFFYEHCNKENNKFSKEELEKIIKDKIDHPAIHCHLLSDSEDIRIGLAVRNPFLFLYQLAYQFLCKLPGDGECNLVEREREFNRLVDAIEENKDSVRISPGKLLGL